MPLISLDATKLIATPDIFSSFLEGPNAYLNTSPLSPDKVQDGDSLDIDYDIAQGSIDFPVCVSNDFSQ